jgi:hypothetical protein
MEKRVAAEVDYEGRGSGGFNMFLNTGNLFFLGLCSIFVFLLLLENLYFLQFSHGRNGLHDDRDGRGRRCLLLQSVSFIRNNEYRTGN